MAVFGCRAGAKRAEGGQGLQHGNDRSKPLQLRRRVLSLIKKKYSRSEEERFGPTLALEHLAEEDGIAIDHETLRGWMLAEGLWSRQPRRKKHCQRRERKSHFGDLVQLDGSFHDWLEQRGPRGCLMRELLCFFKVELLSRFDCTSECVDHW